MGGKTTETQIDKKDARPLSIQVRMQKQRDESQRMERKERKRAREGRQIEMERERVRERERHKQLYSFIYTYAVKLKSGPRFGGFKVKKWPKFKVKKWSKFFFFSLFFPIFIVFWGIFRNTNSATVCQNSVFAKFGGCQK